jgi:hypothetical protein
MRRRALAAPAVAALAAVAALVALPAPLAAQPATARLDGAWSIVRQVRVAPDSTSRITPVSHLLLFAGGHYSQLRVAPPPGLAVLTAGPTTAEEKARRYDEFFANGGRYEVRDTLLTFHVTVAKGPGFAGNRVTNRFRVRGDSLWLVASQPWAADTTKRVVTTTTFVRQR